MDNLTHTLVGMAVAEAAISVRSRRPVPTSWRRAAFLVSIVAGNLPDLDLLLSPLSDGKLGYLLHHRGHTHTLAALPFEAAVLMGGLWLWTRWRPSLWTSRDWWGLSALAALGGLLHLGLDYLNSYGVHVFWPFDDRWSFGDSVFVVEPWLWLLLAAPLIGSMRSTAARAVLRLVVLASLALLWLSGLVPLPMAATASLSGLSVWLVARYLKGRKSAFWPLMAGAIFVAGFAFAGRVIRTRVEAEIARDFPTTRLVDLVLSPLPSNFLCWYVLAVGVESTDYLVRDGMAAFAPRFFPARQCPNLSAGRTAAMVPVVGASASTTVTWSGAYAMPLAELEASRADCRVAAFLRFARVPYRLGDLWGDLRFDREPGEGFAEVRVEGGGGDCPKRVPPWEPPLRL